MGKITPITEQFQHFVRDLQNSLWGDLCGKTRLAWKQFWEGESMQERSRYWATESYERAEAGKRKDYRNGYYERDFVTRLGTLRMRIARARRKSFLPKGLERFQRRSAEVMLLIREAFCGGFRRGRWGGWWRF